MPFFVVAGHLCKDPTTWVGSIVSTLATISSRDGFLPNTLEGCAAIILTLCTIVYIVSKTILLWRKADRPVAIDEEGP